MSKATSKNQFKSQKESKPSTDFKIHSDFSSIPQDGDLPIPMTNDYLFRALLQRNNRVLKGLIISLLHLEEEDVESVVIENPIILGEAINDKTFILDILISLNNNTRIGLEMQVINEQNWVERSLSYLCRSFDHLEKGETYDLVCPVHQIGILNFTLFPDEPEFYANYQLLNTVTHRCYSRKLQLSVLDLTRIDLATIDDQKYKIDYWARLFKAKTWKELHMLAEKNADIKEATETVYHITQEEKIRMQCEAREDYYRRMKGIQRQFEEQSSQLKKVTKENKALTKANNMLSKENEALKKELERLKKGKE